MLSMELYLQKSSLVLFPTFGGNLGAIGAIGEGKHWQAGSSIFGLVLNLSPILTNISLIT